MTEEGELRVAPKYSALQAFLEREDCKLVLESVKDSSSRQRTSNVALFSACAFVGLTTLGFAREQRTLEQDLARSELMAAHAKHEAERAAAQEQTAFAQWNELQARVVVLEGAARVQEQTIALSKDERDVAQRLAAEQRLSREKLLSDQRASANANVKKARDALSAAEQRQSNARQNVADFRKREAERHSEVDTRREPVPSTLINAEQNADAEVSRLERELERAQAEAVSGGAVRAASAGVANQQKPDLVLGEQSVYLQQLSAVAEAKAQASLAESAERAAQRAKEAAEASTLESEKRVNELKERVERNTLTLPLLSVPLRPAIFFVAAPLLLAAIALEGAQTTRHLRMTLKWLADVARTARVLPQLERILVPMRRGLASRVSEAAPFLIAAATLLLLVKTGQQPFATVVALIGVVFAWLQSVGLVRLERKRPGHSPEQDSKQLKAADEPPEEVEQEGLP